MAAARRPRVEAGRGRVRYWQEACDSPRDIHKCIAVSLDADGYRCADPPTRQRRPPLFAIPCNNFPFLPRLSAVFCSFEHP